MTNTIRLHRLNKANWYMVTAGVWVSGQGATATVVTRQTNGSWVCRSRRRATVGKTKKAAVASYIGN